MRPLPKEGTQRHFLKLSYDGSNYHGWQRQLNNITIQEEIERRFEKLFGREMLVLGCGRTDTGVHASQFYAHVDFEPEKFTLEDLHFKLNNMLPGDIAIHEIMPVHPEAHARFDATARTYEYFINLKKNPFKRHYTYIYPIERLDFELMEAYFALLKTYKDFKPLSRFNPDLKTSLCEIMDTKFEQIGEDSYKFTITANRFLRNMVRRIIGTMILIGKGKMSIEHFQNTMEEKGNFKINVSAPPQGLYLTKVKYPYID